MLYPIAIMRWIKEERMRRSVSSHPLFFSPATFLLLDAYIERHHGHRLAALHAVEHLRVAKRSLHVGGQGFDDGALLLGPDAHFVVALEHILEEVARVWKDDALDAFVGGDTGQLLGNLDGAIQAAELVDEAVGLGLLARPDSSLCD